MSRETATLELLDRKMAELASFLSPSEIFRALLEGSAAGAPRAAIFLMREGRWKGWSSTGYPAAATAAQRQATAPADSGWLAALAAEEDVRWRSLTSGEAVPDFGQPHAGDTVGLPVRVGGKAVAILIAERSASEEPWSPAGLSILCQAARLRLELDLAWRRLKSAAAAPAAEAPAPAPAVLRRTEPQGIVEPAVAAAAAATATATELAPWGGVAAGEADTDPRREEARRYARLVATDIRLYNEEAVVVGRKQRDLTKRLGEQLQRGREAFAHRFPDLGPDGVKLLHDAYVQVLAGGDASLI
jgi:phosphoglycolate phosphatase-like HAD superfamily hydrolase